MNDLSPPQIADQGWQVPAFDTAIYGPRTHRYALVIPVINEGERIRGQLLRTRDAGLRVDVIVADGGSSDGSLDPEFIRSAGVRAVLTKTGPGKLSAQLRMAYAWCLRQGYEGIVTIDGNGKDGVEAVTDMVAKLEADCDYVQGSRYLPGGAAENTPLERTIANRLIHAPLLSVAGRHWFTDTTNGFRAYSARYLLHPDVRPFREEFSVYGLLFYLTVRAGQLGLKVDHVAVQRRYPDSGKVPTKIGGLSSKLALLGETVHAATGGNTPDEAARAHPSIVWAAVLALFVALPLLASVIASPPFSPDSWAFYELSRTVFGDFYRFTHFRSYASEVPYSSAFPPLWPVLIATAEAVLGTGARTQTYLAFAFFIGFALVSEQIGRRVLDMPFIGLAAAFTVLLGPSMLLTEMVAGRTIPLQLFLYALVLLGLMAGRNMTIMQAGWVGLAAGLAVMARFDAALLVPFVAGWIGWRTKSAARAAAALAASAVALMPWIAYSLTTFGTLFATDNAGTATTLDSHAFVTDWWPQPQAGLDDDPAAWAGRMIGNVATLVWTGLSLLATPMVALWLAALALPGAFALLAARRPGAAKSRIGAGTLSLVVFSVLLALMLLPQVVTGFFEYRYFTAVFWSAFMVTGGLLAAQAASAAQRRAFGLLICAPVFLAVFAFALAQLVPTGASRLNGGETWSDFDAPPEIMALAQCLADDRSARILVMGDDTFAARAGSQAFLATMMEPRNMAQGRLGADGARAFAQAWQVDYIWKAEPAAQDRAREFFDLERVPGCAPQLLRLSGASQISGRAMAQR